MTTQDQQTTAAGAGSLHPLSFRTELEQLINKHNQEAGSDTPDWILADYLSGCLSAFDAAVSAREKWYGRPKRRVQIAADALPNAKICHGDPTGDVESKNTANGSALAAAEG